MPDAASEPRRDLPASTALVELMDARVRAAPSGRLWSWGRGTANRSETHARLWRRSAMIASGLVRLGVAPGQAVVLLLDDLLDLFPAFWGVVRAGGMAVPLAGLAQSGRRDPDAQALRDILAGFDRPVVLYGEAFAGLGATLAERDEVTAVAVASLEQPVAAWADRPAADPLCLVATSGSTGRVKLAAFGEDTLLARRGLVGDRTVMPAGTVISVFPLDGISGMRALFLRQHGFVHLPVSAFAAAPLSLLDAVETFGAETVVLTNSLIVRLLAASRAAPRRRDLASLRHVLVGAEPIVPAAIRPFYALLAEHGAGEAAIWAGYGTTETGVLAAGAGIAKDARPGDETAALGPVAEGVRLRFVDDRGEVVGEGETGLIEALCPGQIFRGYWRDPEATRAGFTPDGWWRTGDLGRLDAGSLSLHGRAKEIVIADGAKHALAEIDAHLQAGLEPGVRAFACAVHWPGEAAERLAVVFSGGDEASVADAIRARVAQRFGIRPSPVLAAGIDAIPFTPGGKLRRAELARRVRDGEIGEAPHAAEASTGSVPAEGRIARIWREVLELDGPADPHADFFALGGDSMRALQLSVRIEEECGCRVSPEAFFARPTLATLERLVADGRTSAEADAPSAIPWPLPGDLRHRLLRLFESWSGSRPTRDRLIAARNLAGTRMPLIWVFQDNTEFGRLAERLGPEQPLYALRSGMFVIDYAEDEIQALALRYAHEIEEARPEGPIVLGGNCQGAIIALAAAQHLLRRGRHVPLLVLMEWSFPLQAYGGPVLLVYGRDSIPGNPHRRYREPDAVWRQAFAEHASAEISGAHGEFFEDRNIGTLAGALARHLAAAAARPPRVPTRPALRAAIAVEHGPAEMARGETRTIHVRIRNDDAFDWPDAPFGLAMRAGWTDDLARPVAWSPDRAALPAIPAGAEVSLVLPITAPEAVGPHHLIVDIHDQARTWRSWHRAGAVRVRIEVV